MRRARGCPCESDRIQLLREPRHHELQNCKILPSFVKQRLSVAFGKLRFNAVHTERNMMKSFGCSMTSRKQEEDSDEYFIFPWLITTWDLSCIWHIWMQLVLHELRSIHSALTELENSSFFHTTSITEASRSVSMWRDSPVYPSICIFLISVWTVSFYCEIATFLLFICLHLFSEWG